MAEVLRLGRSAVSLPVCALHVVMAVVVLRVLG